MSKTPRTDKHLRWKRENGHVAIISQDFARQLEIELAEVQNEIERLETELREISDYCSKSNLEIDWCKCCTSRKWCKAGTALVDALLAAERKKNEQGTKQIWSPY
jgi:hypothetical protein